MRNRTAETTRPERHPEAGRIVSLRSAGRGGRRTELTFDSGAIHVLDTNVVMDMQIAEGQDLSLEDSRALLEADDLLAAKIVATRQLSYRARSTNEVRQTLTQRGFAARIIEQVIARFIELGYLNDADFARRWIANRGELAPRGTRLLRQELRQKGIETDLADQTLAEAELDDYQTALALGTHRLDRMSGLDRETQRRRLAGFLERRGFSYETVRRVDRELFPY